MEVYPGNDQVPKRLLGQQALIILLPIPGDFIANMNPIGVASLTIVSKGFGSCNRLEYYLKLAWLLMGLFAYSKEIMFIFLVWKYNSSQGIVLGS